MNKNSFILYENFFNAISNKTRFEIIRLLMKKPMSVNEISRKLGFEQSRVSHNLKKLDCCGFVKCKYKGKKRIYSIDKKYILPIILNTDKYLRRYEKRLRECFKK